jgi:hypothetical protein
MGPKEKEKMMETRKMNVTPAMERPRDFPSGFWELTIPSQIKASVIPMVPKRRGLRRPTRSRMKTMKMKSGEVSH